MFPSTAFFHQNPSSGEAKKKMNDPMINGKRAPAKMDRGFVRLDSLEDDLSEISDDCPQHIYNQTPRTSRKVDQNQITSKKVDQNLPPSPSSKESKWFGNYPQTDHRIGHHRAFQSVAQPPHLHHHQQPWSYYQPYQVPYNLTKGQFEVWPFEPAVEMMQHQGCYLQQPSMSFNQGQHNQIGGQFTRCVNYMLGGVSALASAMTTSLSFSYFSSSSAAEATASITASEVVAKATLGPNAKSFTPLNPNAKEFHPAESRNPSQQVPDPNEPQKEPVTPPNGSQEDDETENKMITPEMKLEMKSVALRKCTPWIPKGTVKEQDLDISNIAATSNGSLQSTDISEEDELETEDEDDDAYNDESRPRLLSICSSEDGFIQFEEISPRCRSPPKIKENCSQFLKNFLVGVEDDDEDDSEEDDDWNNDEISDWDKSVDAIFMDDESLLEECGLHCQWMVQPKPKIKSIDTVDKSNNSFEDNAESYPNNGAQDYDVILKRIKTANDTWINSMEATDILKSSDNKVTFSEPLVTLEVEEDPTIAKDLQALRIDPQVQRHADKLRNERLFTPIFKDEHRAKMRSYIDNCF